MNFLFVLLLIVAPSYCAKEKCEVCREMTKKFIEGMDRTSGHNFGGGNTDWEETRLGSWADSETRLVDIMEKVCSTTECHSLVEEHEEDIESWWFKHKSKGLELEAWLCIDTIKVCCPSGKFGPTCEECPGGSSSPCSNHGECKGEGTRSGSGECECEKGYTASSCNECGEGFYKDDNNSSELTCLECHESCDGACHDGTPKGCETCRDGWTDSEEHGCTDIDECLSVDVCNAKEYCVNTAGSFTCNACDVSCAENCTGAGNKACLACKTGYEMTESDGCQDIDECAQGNVTCEDGKHCSNTPGSYECIACHNACSICSGPGSENCTSCNSGFELTDKGCEDVDECKNAKLCPEENEHCENMPGFYTCKCDAGFKRKDGKCVQGKKPRRSKKSKDEDEKLMDEVKRGNFVEEWHLKVGSLLYAVFFGLLLWAISKRSALGVISLVIVYLGVLFGIRTKYRDANK